MIQITLTFNSIEAARAALLEIPTSALAAPAAAKVEAPKPSAKAEKPAATQPAEKAAKPASTETATASPSEGNVTPAATTTASHTASPASSSEPAKSVDYPTLQKAVFALAGKSRDAAAAVAGSFGVKTFKELPEDKWGDALAAVSDKLAELEAA